MRPAPSTHSTATTMPAAGCVPGADPASEADARRPEWADEPTIANATSRTTVSATAAATTAISANVAQSMCTVGPLSCQAARSAAGDGATSGTSALTLSALTELRRDAT